MPQQPGYITLAPNAPMQTNAGSETILTFTSQADQVTVQNNTPQVAWIAFDSPVTSGAKLVQPGAMLVESKLVTVVHVLTPTAVNINNTTLPNIVVLGES